MSHTGPRYDWNGIVKLISKLRQTYKSNKKKILHCRNSPKIHSKNRRKRQNWNHQHTYAGPLTFVAWNRQFNNYWRTFYGPKSVPLKEMILPGKYVPHVSKMETLIYDRANGFDIMIALVHVKVKGQVVQ